MNEKIVCKEKCSGCEICKNVCPSKAIRFIDEGDGFEYPMIDKNKCINCGLCTVCCSQMYENEVPEEYELCRAEFAARNCDEKIVSESSSGGCFSAIAEYVIEKQGTVYGVSSVNDGSFLYARVEDKDTLKLLRGSKYIQARMTREIIKGIENDLRENRIVLFAGTSCYVGAIKQYVRAMKIDDSKLIYVDFLCMGVISPVLWRKYLYKKTGDEKISNVTTFRSKITGWENFSISVQTANGLLTEPWNGSIFGKLSQCNYSLRPLCARCPYAGARNGDITLGDFWNEEYLPKEFLDDKGVNILKVNTDKGIEVINEISKKIIRYRALAGMVLDERRGAVGNDRERSLFWEKFYNDYEGFVEKYGKYKLMEKIKWVYLRPLLIKSRIIKIVKRTRHGLRRIEKCKDREEELICYGEDNKGYMYDGVTER